MNLYAWVTPAFISKGSPVDHTWVTTYDSQSLAYLNIGDVKNGNHDFWYCWGGFHKQGKPGNPILSNVAASSSALCLVGSNDANERGTIQWYGIDGVCHQVSNQVLYATATTYGGKPKIVNDARGYKLSSAIFGTYGRREKLWREARIKCGVAPISVINHNATASLLTQRLSWFLACGVNDEPVKTLEIERRNLLRDIDSIGFTGSVNERKIVDRVGLLNSRINQYLEFAGDYYLNNEEVFKRVFGIKIGEWVELIDSELFVLPDSPPPERNYLVGW